jgi:hypothetical protein
MSSQREKVLETLAGPDMIQDGDFGELLAVRLYPETPIGEKRMWLPRSDLCAARLDL